MQPIKIPLSIIIIYPDTKHCSINIRDIIVIDHIILANKLIIFDPQKRSFSCFSVGF